ncbi:MAG: T9SS type A sorting domain-containing protein [Bacteroidales bacterium]|nr:T9SS type A sorting domain-containing protein [Bacteroidales bacterium]
MNIKNLVLSTLVVSLFIAVSFVLLQNVNHSAKNQPRQEENEQGIAGALEWYNQIRQNPATGTVDYKDVMKARQQVARLAAQKSRSFNIQWENIGPNNIGGRTRAILVDKDNSSIIYAGSVAGGLFKSINGGQSWKQVNGGALFSNIAISCIGQAPNGDIYVGTGEYFATPSGTNSGSGAYGQGMWKSTDGETFTHLLSTWPDTTITYDGSSDWLTVNEIAFNTSTGRVFAATKGGLYISDDAGSTWTEVESSLIRDVKVDSNGKVYSIRNNNLYISDDGGNTFTGVSGVSSGGRMEIAIAPSNNNYIYIFGAAGDGSFGKMYRSTDGGTTFSVLFDGSSETLSPFGSNNQGWYDNIVAVYPDDPTHILFGGVDLYSYSDAENYQHLTGWYLDETNWLYVHADQHAIVFDPKYDGVNNKKIYFGCDGGIFKSDDGGQSFSNLNRGYITTQFYGMGIGGHGDVIGGCQDNGTPYIDRQGSEPTTGQEISGGDGGDADISFLRPEVLFTSLYYGQIYRTETYGSDMDYMYDSRILGTHNIGLSGGGEPFVTRFSLWESFNDSYSQDSVMVHYDGYSAGGVAKDTAYVGDTVSVQSNTRNRYITHILTTEDLLPYGGLFTSGDSLIAGDSIMVLDPYQAVFAVGLSGEVFVTRDPVDFTKVPCDWSLVAVTSGPASALAWSKDGNNLYIGDGYNGNIYRVSNFSQARTKQEMEQTDTANCLLDYKKIQTFSGRYITSISVDPQNPANIVVTLGNYGQATHVYYSTNATSSSPTFIDITGNLPEMPVYASTILWNNSLKVIIGTEYGTYACENILSGSPVWEDVNGNGLANVPVFQLVQQVIPNFWVDGNTGISNHGYVYAATHGKGIYQTATFHGPVDVKPVPQKPVFDELTLYPNPASDFVNIDFELDSYQQVSLSVFNLKGQKVISKEITNQTVGQNHIQVNVKDLSKGVYLVKLQTGSKSKIKKLIIK